jgi:hypothetical protein
MPSSPSPKLPKWIFFLTDAILLLTAWLIANRSSGPLSVTAIYAITACVITGAILGTIPLLLHYEREKNETLDDRQRSLEALALTLTTAAEQIGIAAKGLHEITELAQKNLQQAEQLPQKLQAQVTEFQAQLAGARDEEREELKQELAALRAAESSQLTATADKVAQAAAELTKLEAATQKTLAAAQAALAKTPETLTAATATALAEIESKLAARTALTLAAIAEAAAKASAPATPAADDPGPPGGVERRKSYARRAADIGQHITPIVPATIAPFAGHIVSAMPESPELTADSPEKPRLAEVGEHLTPIVPPTAAPFAGNLIAISPAPTEDTAASVAATAEPVVPPAPPAEAPAVEPAPDAPVSATPEAAVEPAPAKKRAPRKPKPVETAESALDLGMAEPAVPVVADEFSQVAPNEPTEKVISSDGATRLQVTAYIGIGNRLFIRGDGPGLSWDKGVPLQFVSIGKWRWETAEATAPVKFKLYKNDDMECAALGNQTLDSGHQQEITATF